jgi:molybdopterin synthase catalytic subunit
VKVRALFFALYRDRVGTARLEVELPEGAQAGDLVLRMVQRYPRLASHPERVVVAVNQEYVKHEHPLRDGDEVAFIPPVSGGQR